MHHESNPLELSCPSCGNGIELALSQCVVGVRVRCLYCGAEAVVVEVFEEHRGRKHWALEDPDDAPPQAP